LFLEKRRESSPLSIPSTAGTLTVLVIKNKDQHAAFNAKIEITPEDNRNLDVRPPDAKAGGLGLEAKRRRGVRPHRPRPTSPTTRSQLPPAAAVG